MINDGNTIRAVISELGTPDFTTSTTYNHFCRRAVEAWRKCGGSNTPSPRFCEERATLESSDSSIIRTGWGGVHVTKYEHPNVEKYLIVDSGRYLAYEVHEEKSEALTHVAGTGILVVRALESTDLKLVAVQAGFSIEMEPGQEHCLIALDNLLVFEQSIDPKGMDQDLIFIHTPDEP